MSTPRPTQAQLLALCDFAQELRAILGASNSGDFMLPGFIIGSLPATWLRAYDEGLSAEQAAERLVTEHTSIWAEAV